MMGIRDEDIEVATERMPGWVAGKLGRDRSRDGCRGRSARSGCTQPILTAVAALDVLSWFFFFFFQAEDGIRDESVTGVQTCAFLFQAEDGIRDESVTGVQTCALPIYH